MKILVTGATGFLGLRFCEQAHSAGYKVLATGRDVQKGISLQQQGIDFIPGDLTNPHFVNQIVAGCDVISHCAALSTVWAKYNQFYQANVLSVEHLISAAQKHDLARFVHISSPSVYVGAFVKENIKEHLELPKKSANAYIHTKKISEQLLRKQASTGSFQTVILRPQGIFGPQDSSIIPRLLAASKNRGIPLVRGGQHLVDITYVDNVCQAMRLSLHAKLSDPISIYNISNGEPTVFLELLHKLFDSLHQPLRYKSRPYWLLHMLAFLYETSYKKLKIQNEPPLTRYTLSVLSESRTLDIQAARSQLGYNPEISLDEGIARYAQWYHLNKGY